MLSSIEFVQPLSLADGPLLEEIKTVLTKHKANHRFGICLLHDHPQVGQHEDEILVETSDIPNQQLITRPSKRSEVPPTMVETMWMFDNSGRRISIEGCQQKIGGGHV